MRVYFSLTGPGKGILISTKPGPLLNGRLVSSRVRRSVSAPVVKTRRRVPEPVLNSREWTKGGPWEAALSYRSTRRGSALHARVGRHRRAAELLARYGPTGSRSQGCEHVNLWIGKRPPSEARL